MKLSPAASAEFSKLAHLVSHYKFTTSLTEAQAKIVETLQSRGKPKNVYLLGAKWAVKYYCAGMQRVWATREASDYASSYRLADVLILRLYNKRVKATLPLSDDSLNITLERAKLDNENEGGLVSLLIQMEALLPEPEPRASRFGQSHPSTSERFAKFESTILAAITEATRRSDDAAKRLSDEITQLRSELQSMRIPVPSTLQPVMAPPIIDRPYIGDPMPPCYPSDAPIVTCGAFSPVSYDSNTKRMRAVKETGCASVEQDASVVPQ